MTIDELQALRMALAWPAIVGSSAFLLARLIYWLLYHKLGRGYTMPCVIVGTCAGVVAAMISREWDDGYSYWLWFTAGTFALAVILLMTAAQLAVDMWHHDDV